MANILSSILSSFKKKDEDELNIAPAPAPKPVSAPTNIASNFNQPPQKQGFQYQGSGIQKAIQGTSNFLDKVNKSVVGAPARFLFGDEVTGTKAETPKEQEPGILREVFTRPFAEIPISVAEKVSGQKIQLDPSRDAVGQTLFGNKPLRSYQEKARTGGVDTLVDLGVDREQAEKLVPFMAVAGIALDVTPPGIDDAGKKVLPKVIKTASKGDEAVEFAVKKADEIAPMLKKVLPEVKGSIDDALKVLEDKGIKVADDLVKKLKSGKVVEGEGFVFQNQEKAGKFIANIDDNIKAFIPEVKKVTKDVTEQATKRVKETTETARETLEELRKPLKETAEDVPTKLDEARVDDVLPGDVGDVKVDEAVEEVTKKLDDYSAEVQEELSKSRYQNYTPEQKIAAAEVMSDETLIKQISDAKGDVLTRDDVAEQALKDQSLLDKIFKRGDSAKIQAQVQNSMNRLAELAKRIETEGSTEVLQKAFAEEFLKIKSVGTFFGRGLEQMKALGNAGAPTGSEILADIFSKTKASTDEVVEAFSKVDMNNPEQVRKFYYDFVEPTMSQVVDEYRYINILSSPKTQIRNVNANLIDSIITEPGTKVMRGFVDAVKSTVTRKPRQNFSGEAVAYYKGYFPSIKQAFSDAMEVMKGNRFVENPDLSALSAGKYAKGTIQSQLEGIKLPTRIAEPIADIASKGLEKGGVVNKMLEAGDIFFSTLVKNGEEAAQAYRQSRGVGLSPEDIAREADRVAKDVLLRNNIGEKGQGFVNDYIVDGIASTISQLRNSNQPVVRTTANAVFPFVRTTANYVKRFLDYTPGAGLVNLAGRSDVDELVARQLWGSTLMLGSMWYAFKQGAGDNMTWEAPTGEKERELFYASGRKPYSMKVGDQWVSYQQMGMIGAPFALTAALKHQIEQDKDVSESDIQSVARAYGSMLPYFGDMSFARSFGNLSDALSGDGDAIQKLINEPFRQAVPLAGFTGWAKSIIDPVYRKSESKSDNPILDAIAPTLKNIPGLSQQYEAYTDPLGQESRIDKPWLNAFSPITIQSDNPVFGFLYENKRLESQANKLERDFKEGSIDLGGVERGVNQILENAMNSFGGDKSQAPEFNLPEGVDRGIKLPEKEKEKINITPEQMQELEAQLPGIKQRLLAGITGSGVNLSGISSPSTTSSVSGGISTKKIGSPPSQKLSSSTGINLASGLQTESPKIAQVSGITLPQNTQLSQTLPSSEITADELLRRARNRRA